MTQNEEGERVGLGGDGAVVGSRDFCTRLVLLERSPGV